MATSSAAPGQLEQVREFLNTWELPHATRIPRDGLGALASSASDWRASMPTVPLPAKRELAELVRLRSTLRALLDSGDPAELNVWLEKRPVEVTVGEANELGYVARKSGSAAVLLTLVVQALASGQWSRMKACPDCRHVFYDNSRNRTRTWCAMYAQTPDGRACGSISKVRSYRNRQRAG